MDKESKKFHVEGMHCPSCELYMEKKLKTFKNISDIKSDHKKQTVSFKLDTKKQKEKELISQINEITKQDGYTVMPLKEKEEKREERMKENKDGVFLKAFLIALGISIFFYLLQRLNIFQGLALSDNLLVTAFLIGIVASFSSCMAVVGSIVITISTKPESKKSLLIFHISRIVAFFLLGGILGLIGSAFVFTDNFHTITGIILILLMLIMGFSLLDIFPFFKNLQPKLPKGLSKETFQNSTSPLLLGILTFILPCGFTQSTQIIAITTGNILDASLIMLLFALGTLPILALLSFGVTSLKKKVNTQLLFKTSGFVIIFFALYTLLTLLISLGIINILI